MGTTVKNETKTNEVSKNEPPSWAQPGLSELGARISSIIPTVPGEKYTGDFVAQPSAMEQGIPGLFQGSADFARSMMIPAMAAMGMGLGTPASFQGPGVGAGLQGFGSYDASAVQPVIEQAISPVFRQLREQTLPTLQSSAIDAGAYSGDRAMSVLPGMAIRDATENANDIATRIAYEDFNNQQNRFLQGFGLSTQRGLGEADVLTSRLGQFPGLLDSVMRMQTGATDMDAAAAAYDTALRQRELDNKIQQTEYGIRYPFQGLDVAAALLGQIANPWGIRTTNGTSSSTQSSGGLGQILQGAMGAGMMALGMPGGGGLSNLFKSQPTMGALTGPRGAIGM